MGEEGAKGETKQGSVGKVYYINMLLAYRNWPLTYYEQAKPAISHFILATLTERKYIYQYMI